MTVFAFAHFETGSKKASPAETFYFACLKSASRSTRPGPLFLLA
jgi:hypothetical protein